MLEQAIVVVALVLADWKLNVTVCVPTLGVVAFEGLV